MSTVLISILVVAGVCILLAIGYINHIVENNRLERARQKADLADRLRRCEMLNEALPGQMMSPSLKALLCRLQLHYCQGLLNQDKRNSEIRQRCSALQADVDKGEAISADNPPLKISSEAIAKEVGFQLEGLQAQIAYAAQKRLLNAEQVRHWLAEIGHMTVLMNIELFNSLGQAALQQNHPGQARLAFERGVQYLRKVQSLGKNRYQQSLQVFEAQLERANALVLQHTASTQQSSELDEGLKQLDSDELWKKKSLYD
jgi:hypothetical protein